jgi:hypothetical protein
MTMKKIFIMALAVLMCCSCDEFLTKNPKNDISADAFFNSENDLEMYTNKWLNDLSYEDYVYGDQYTDYMGTRSSTPFLIGGKWNANQQGAWGWGGLRSINYMLDNMEKCKGNVSETIYNHYEGVARFWRASYYWDKVKTYGGVPWYDHVLKNNDEEDLYKVRDSRQTVMRKILEDLNFACDNCSASTQFTSSSTRISKYVALALKSRICLWEGTYRKYHTELALDSAEFYLRESIKASEELMNSGAYSLVDVASNRATQYRALFNTQNLKTQEVIWGIAFAADLRMHSLTWDMTSATAGNNWSFNRQILNMYLMQDGSRYTDRADYNTQLFKDEFDNRDLRLTQTVINPSYTRKDATGKIAPYSPHLNTGYTGYQPIKWLLDDAAYDAKANGYNSIPIFRYAEILLNEAEAKAELGEMDETVWNKTIKLLRDRAGVKSTVPATYDPYLAAYYKNQTTDKWILEVRRERTTEMAMEWTRYQDLMRWKMGELLAQPWQGVYVPKTNTLMDLNGDGTNDLYVSTSSYSGAKDKNAFYIVSNGKTNGSTWNVYQQDNHLWYGTLLGLVWQDKMYLHPIPQASILKNKNLTQNPGWE